jgi:hypothetical protein
MNNPSRTDWARVDSMTDDEIDTSDISPVTEEFFARAKLRLPNVLDEDEMQPEYDLKSLRVRKLGPGRKSFNGSSGD